MSKKIMVVDDEESVRCLLQDVLEDEGYEVMAAHDGLDALEKLKAFTPDVMLVDLMMPNMPGGVLAERVRDDAKTCHIPLIFLTGVFDDEEAKMIENRFAGERLIAKPVASDVLLAMIAEALQ